MSRPGTRKSVVWDVGEQIQRLQWKKTIEDAGGNITKAGEARGFTKAYAMRLTRRHKLNDFAAKIRQRLSGRVRGRPKKVCPK